jgi:hypothetical protein
MLGIPPRIPAQPGGPNIILSVHPVHREGTLLPWEYEGRTMNPSLEMKGRRREGGNLKDRM